ncbi:MAG: TetR/AcrR family transcriptional regulator [Candidatus Omnitrophota bacterium]
MQKRCNSREIIIDAAEAVVMEMGATHMSLDEVSKKAGVSKGGLMYHFPNKDSLLKAMIQRLVAQFYMDRDVTLGQLKKSPARILKANILTALQPNIKRQRMGLSILVVAAHNPELLESLKEAYRQHLKDINDSGLDFERAAIISLATDGLMLLEILGLSPYSLDQKDRIKDMLVKMMDESVLKTNKTAIKRKALDV